MSGLVAARYDLPGPFRCTLLNRGFNDMFVVRAADDRRYVLRMSGRRRRGPAGVAGETTFLAHLDALGGPVAAAVPTRGGALFTDTAMPKGPRAVVLFHGRSRKPTWTRFLCS